jgi:hypothetical protein
VNLFTANKLEAAKPSLELFPNANLSEVRATILDVVLLAKIFSPKGV